VRGGEAATRLPAISGRPIEVRIRRSLGPHLAATFIRRRLILLDSEVLAQRGDFERILVHELFHFVWIRLSNAVRRDWENTVGREIGKHVRGELGWSAERRKLKLAVGDAQRRGRPWRLYVCEAFCDTAAWRYAGLKTHPEFTLGQTFRRTRRAWFQKHIEAEFVLI
jgi:hypothetical protein